MSIVIAGGAITHLVAIGEMVIMMVNGHGSGSYFCFALVASSL